VKQKTASGNQLKALLLEFNIRVSARNGGLGGVIESVLKNAENEFSMPFREALSAAWQHHLFIIKSISTYDTSLENSAEEHEGCKRLLKLEGVGVVNAVNLYIALGCADLGSFCKGKDASACIGLTPIQHTSGGTVKMGSIGKYVKNGMLRSQLITGAMSAVAQICKRTALTNKELWIQKLVARRGKKIAAVALANKTVRTAFSCSHKVLNTRRSF
jgi:transposase